MRMDFLAPMAAAAGALAFGLAMATPATAANGDFLGGCLLTDLTSPNADGCNGFYQGNMLNDSPTDLAIQTSALAALGLTWDGTLEEAQLDLNSQTIDFLTLLSGVTYIGVHWGKGEGPVDVQGGVTGFYRLDLAPDAELDVILSAFGSQSGARLYFTNPCVGGDCGGGGGNEIPEPATWAMMILGFGGVGVMMRRRRTATSPA
jgi:hypothetical protein